MQPPARIESPPSRYTSYLCSVTLSYQEMELSTAIALIGGGIQKASIEPQTWADLGAGTGLFSQALATLLPPASQIYAVDRDQTALNEIAWSHTDKRLVRLNLDIDKKLELPPLDGAVLANVLHFIRDQPGFLKQLQRQLRQNGVFIIIEYDTTTGNKWVPYPISLDRMKKMTASLDLDLLLLGTVRSKYNAGILYSVLLRSQQA